ncbi:FxDxF family PEP-CTERM protein [Janthinobacterium sp. FW305-129]|uniref:FxDxF family PEP-CTERM protein n=1 Tax=Janthinobacterium sp. FW305-129 TaxID=2775054 RepID=UPI001E4B60C6|nr:FxDxF family PEP-CTERM protein [Janthinobacterium sp. FW305-129]MCC7596946.1 FxDxF family PEP-CTERM protein [Janthinobacterium sp. FW305-129]
MNMPATLIKIAALTSLITAGAANAATELVVNGSFESNAINTPFAQLSAVTGWTSSVSGNTAFEIQKGATQGGQSGFNPVAAAGTQYLELNAARLTSVSQAIATTAGGTYALSFAYSGRPDTAGGANSLMNVYWGSTLLTPTALVGTTTGVWQTYSQNVTALGSSSLLRFESVGPVSAPTYGSYLDNVSVTTAVPEPESYAMMLLGLGLLGFMARRKNAA